MAAKWFRGMWRTKDLRWYRFRWWLKVGSPYTSVGIMSVWAELIENEMDTEMNHGKN